MSEEQVGYSDEEFKDLRHRYYKLGKTRANILTSLGYKDFDMSGSPKGKEAERLILFAIRNEGRLRHLIAEIEMEEKRQALDAEEIEEGRE